MDCKRGSPLKVSSVPSREKTNGFSLLHVVVLPVYMDERKHVPWQHQGTCLVNVDFHVHEQLLRLDSYLG